MADDKQYLEQLIELCKQMFERKHYEAAHHLIGASIHLARDMEDEDSLHLLRQLAQDQYDWINTNEPDSPMSSHSAHEHNKLDLYRNTLQQADLHFLILQNQRRRNHGQIDSRQKDG